MEEEEFLKPISVQWLGVSPAEHILQAQAITTQYTKEPM